MIRHGTETFSSVYCDRCNLQGFTSSGALSPTEMRGRAALFGELADQPGLDGAWLCGKCRRAVPAEFSSACTACAALPESCWRHRG